MNKINNFSRLGRQVLLAAMWNAAAGYTFFVLAAQGTFASGVLILLSTLLLIVPLLALATYVRRRHTGGGGAAGRQRSSLALAVLLLVPLIVALIAFIRLPQIERETFASLHAVAELKSGQISNWLGERYADSESLRMDATFTQQVARYARQAQTADGAAILQRFTHLRELYAYKSVMLFDGKATLLLSEGDALEMPPDMQARIRGALEIGAVVRTDPFLAPETQMVHIDWIVPLGAALLAEGSPKGGSSAVVVLRQTLDEALFPMIQTWPVASPSAETLLISREGGFAVFMNELRYKKNTAMRLKFPLEQDSLPAVVAIRAEQPGTTVGLDYRDRVVQAAYHQVNGTRWLVVAKIDRAEMLSPLWPLMLWVSVILFAAVLAVLLVLERLWREQEENFQLSLLARKSESERLMQKFFELPFAGMAIVGPDNRRLLQFNGKLCEILGYSRDEMAQHTWMDVTHPDDLALSHARYQEAMTGNSDGYTIEKRYVHKHGHIIHAQVDVRVVHRPDGSPEYFVAIIEDISERKRVEARLQRATRFYAALSHCNEHIMRCENREALLEQVCSDAVVFGEVKMAWIGLVEDDGRIVPVASAGEGRDYLDGLQVSLNADSPFGQGPTGTAVRENRPVWCNHFPQQENTRPWHSRVSAMGWLSSAALPLQCNGRVVGALNLYAGDDDAFDEAVQSLLQEMAVNISFALERLAREQELAEQKAQMARLLQAVEQSTNTVVITDLDAHIEYANPSFERTTGYTLAEVRQQNPRVLQSGKTPEATYRDMWEHLTRGESWRGEFVNRRKDGSELTEFVHVSPVRQADGKITHYLAIKQDITEMKVAQQALAALNADLEAKVLDRTEKLARASQEAERANLAKSAFLANMSHEIRTPMNAIIGLVQLLHRTPLSREQHAQLKKIDGAAGHLLTLINDILDLSKIEAGHLELEQTDFDLIALLDNVYSMMAGTAGKKGLTLHTHVEHVPRCLRGDPTRLRQALINYVSNAIKFTHHGTVSISVESIEAGEDGLLLRFSVRDTGIGIPADKQARLFQSFEQADTSTTRQYGGTGLGLSITKHLAGLMGGQAGCSSTAGEGSVFWFTARLQPGSAQEVPMAAHSPAHVEAALARHAGARILLADDVEINREVILMLLEHTGLVVDEAENGAEAVARAKQNPYQLILMDMQMPVMDGLDATREIHRLAGCTDLPVIALTANVFIEDRRRCLEAGMVDFIAKPVSQVELLAKLLFWLEGGRYALPAPALVEPRADLPLTDEAGLPAHLPGMDIAAGLGVWRAPAVYVRFLHHFIEENGSVCATAFHLHEGGDSQALSALMHKTRGAAANLALTEVPRLAAAIESHIKTGKAVGALLNEFAAAFETAMASIATLAAIVAATPAQADTATGKPEIQLTASLPDETAAGQVVQQLEALLASLDTDAPDEAERMLDSLSTRLPEASLALIRSRLESFDFRGTAQEVRDLIAVLQHPSQGGHDDTAHPGG